MFFREKIRWIDRTSANKGGSPAPVIGAITLAPPRRPRVAALVSLSSLAFKRLESRCGVQLRPYRCQDCAAAAVPEEPWTWHCRVAQGLRTRPRETFKPRTENVLTDLYRQQPEWAEILFDRTNCVACYLTTLLYPSLRSMACYIFANRWLVFFLVGSRKE